MHQEIVRFWFEEITPQQWWAVDPACDGLLRERYGSLLERAAQGELYGWRAARVCP